MPNWKKVIVSGSDAILNEITSSGGILTSQDIMPDVDNTLSLGSSTQRFQLNGGTPVTVNGSGTANTLTRFLSATTVEDSKILSSNTLTTITHNNNGNDIFIVSGSNGELIKVTDTIDNTLFQVNDGSGISMFEVSSSGQSIVNGDLDADDVTIDGWGSVSASLSTLTTDVSDISSGSIHPIQLVVDTKNLSDGHVSWFSITDLQANAARAFTTWIAPSDGFLDEVVVSPEQGNTTTDTFGISFMKNAGNQGTVNQTLGAAGVLKTYTFGSATYSFSKGDKLGLLVGKNTNTSDLYNVMVTFRLTN